MNFYHPLQADLFRFGKRSQLSLDGTIKGVVYDQARGAPVTAPVPTAGPAPLYERPVPMEYLPHGGPPPHLMPSPATPDLSHTPRPMGPVFRPPEMSVTPNLFLGADAYSAMMAVNAAIDGIHREWQAMHDAVFGVIPVAWSDPTPQAIREMFILTPRRSVDAVDYGSPPMSVDQFDDAITAASARAPDEIASDSQVDAIDAMFHAPTHAVEPLDYQEAAMTPELFAQETSVAPDLDIPDIPSSPITDFYTAPTPTQTVDDGSAPFFAAAASGPGPLDQIVQEEWDQMLADAAPNPGQPMAPGADPLQMMQDMYDLMMQQQMAPYMMPGMPPGPGPA